MDLTMKDLRMLPFKKPFYASLQDYLLRDFPHRTRGLSESYQYPIPDPKELAKVGNKQIWDDLNSGFCRICPYAQLLGHTAKLIFNIDNATLFQHKMSFCYLSHTAEYRSCFCTRMVVSLSVLRTLWLSKEYKSRDAFGKAYGIDNVLDIPLFKNWSDGEIGNIICRRREAIRQIAPLGKPGLILHNFDQGKLCPLVPQMPPDWG